MEIGKLVWYNRLIRETARRSKVKYQCRHVSEWGRRCSKGTLRGKDYCADHIKSHTFAIGKTAFSPNPINETQYSSYLQSEAWKLRAQAERQRNNRCSLCNRRGCLHVHHRTYVRLGQEEEGDLIVLCEDCHEMFHSHYTYDGRLGYFIRKK